MPDAQVYLVGHLLNVVRRLVPGRDGQGVILSGGCERDSAAMPSQPAVTLDMADGKSHVAAKRELEVSFSGSHCVQIACLPAPVWRATLWRQTKRFSPAQ